MQLDVVNNENKKVGAVDVRDDVFGGRVNTDLMWESVVHANAAERRGTHATKNRALVSGSGKKPWRQKGTGRAQRRLDPDAAVAPRRHRVRAAAPQLRLPAAEEGRARRAAGGARPEDEGRRAGRRRRAVGRRDQDEGGGGAAEAARRHGKAVLVDVAVDEKLSRSVRNIPGVSLVPSARLTARDVINAGPRRRDEAARSRSCRRRSAEASRLQISDFRFESAIQSAICILKSEISGLL